VIVTAYGGGMNSTAFLVRIALDEVEELMPDVTLFANTGGERPETMDYIAMFSEWCVKHGLPEIITVCGAFPQQKIDGTLENECLRLGVLPSRVYGAGSCSMKWKREPQDRYIKGLPEAQAVWDSGEKILKLIGYEYGEEHRADRDAFRNDPKYKYRFPLIEWEMDRDGCKKEIMCRAGLPSPGKSSCFYCPSMKQSEIRAMAHTNPELIARAIAMEENAQESLTNIKGLGRQYAWSELLATDDMFPDAFNDSVDEACGCYDG